MPRPRRRAPTAVIALLAATGVGAGALLVLPAAEEPTPPRTCDSYWKLTDEEFAELVYPGARRFAPLHPIMICNVVTGESVMAATVVIDRHVTTAGVSLVDRSVLNAEEVAEFERKAKEDRREKYGALAVELYERLAGADGEEAIEVLISLRLPPKAPSTSTVQPAHSWGEGPRPTPSAEQRTALAEDRAAMEEYEARIVARTKSFADRISSRGARVARPVGTGYLAATVSAALLRELARDPLAERIMTRPKPVRLKQLTQEHRLPSALSSIPDIRARPPRGHGRWPRRRSDARTNAFDAGRPTLRRIGRRVRSSGRAGDRIPLAVSVTVVRLPSLW